MTPRDLDLQEPPACPLLGLAGDRRTRFTFPHSDHRCHATHKPSPVDRRRQSAYCLGAEHLDCERFRAHVPATPAAPTAEPTSGQAVAPPLVVHVFRPGDSLARIAAAYGVTIEEVMVANNLARTSSVVDGQRLVIPIGQPPARGSAGAAPVPTRPVDAAERHRR